MTRVTYRVFGESVRSSLAARATSGLVAVIVGACVLAITLTTGQSAATQQQVLDRVDAAGSRAVRIERVQGAPDLPGNTIAVIERLDRVEWVLGMSAPLDGRNVALGQSGDAVAFRTVVGQLPGEVRLPERRPRPPEALVPTAGADTLGLIDAVGAIELSDRRRLPVVGTFDATGPAAFLTRTGIVITSDADVGLQRIELLVTDTSSIDAVTSAVLAIIDADPADLTVVRASALADLDALLRSDLRASGRRLLLGVLTTGALLIAATTTAQTMLRRKDLGRRRALGATRGMVIALVVLQTVLPATLGALLGTGAGLALGATGQIAHPPASFMAGVVTLALIATIIASLAPAVTAAHRDPLAVLRAP